MQGVGSYSRKKIKGEIMEIYEIEKEWGKIFRKVIIILQVITLVTLLVLTVNEKAETNKKENFFYMEVTAYSLHKNCIADKWNDGMTATNTKIRERICAINVDYINGEWVVKSPLKLGQRIFIEELGEFSIEDTGYFSDEDFKRDFWTVDIYMKDYNKALEFGRQYLKVTVKED